MFPEWGATARPAALLLVGRVLLGRNVAVHRQETRVVDPVPVDLVRGPAADPDQQCDQHRTDDDAAGLSLPYGVRVTVHRPRNDAVMGSGAVDVVVLTAVVWVTSRL